MSFFSSIIGPAVGLVGGLLGNKSDEKIADQNIDMQREFAQNGIRWKVEDAKAAGIHPLAALGAQTASFSPVSVGSNLGDTIRSFGQDVSRAVSATQTAAERAWEMSQAKERQRQLDELNLQRHQADLTHMDLQNQYLASQIKRLEAQSNPPMPDVVSSPVRRETAVPVELKSNSVPYNRPGRESVEAGNRPGFVNYRIGGPKTGFNMELPGQQMSESLENAGPLTGPLATGYHWVSSAIDRMLGATPKVPPQDQRLPKGYVWKWDPATKTFIATRSR